MFDHPSLVQRVAALEQTHQDHRHREYQLLATLDDLENRGCRNNIKLRGIPEARAHAGLPTMVRAILNAYQNEALDSLLELDIMHRVGDTQGKPMDILSMIMEI